MASPHPQPSAVAKLKGTDQHNPQRYRGRAKEPQPVVGIGEPPGWMAGEAAIVWIELRGEIAPGVLTLQDRRMYSILCSLIAEFQAAPTEITGAKLSILTSIASQFGMSPSSRTKVATIETAEQPDNPFAKFAGKLHAVS